MLEPRIPGDDLPPIEPNPLKDGTKPVDGGDMNPDQGEDDKPKE
jgi:hypothetical protein